MYHSAQANYLEIIADSDPTLLARVCGILGGLSLIPTRFGSVANAATGSVHITINISGGTRRQLDLVQRKLSQLTSVHSVWLDAGDARG